jgi:hypothetical protein
LPFLALKLEKGIYNITDREKLQVKIWIFRIGEQHFQRDFPYIFSVSLRLLAAIKKGQAASVRIARRSLPAAGIA